MEAQVSLRPVREDDLPLLDRLTHDPEVTGPLEWYGWRSAAPARRRWAEDGLLGEGDGTLMVVRGREPIGGVAWHRVATGRNSYCWNIAIALVPEARGHGYGAHAQRLLARYLFAHTQVNRVEAGTKVSNVAEQRALERAGFTREGVLRGYSFQGGRWHDTVLYSVLRDEVGLDGQRPGDGDDG